MSRCECSIGGDCSKMAVCAHEAVVQDLEDEIKELKLFRDELFWLRRRWGSKVDDELETRGDENETAKSRITT